MSMFIFFKVKNQRLSFFIYLSQDSSYRNLLYLSIPLLTLIYFSNSSLNF